MAAFGEQTCARDESKSPAVVPELASQLPHAPYAWPLEGLHAAVLSTAASLSTEHVWLVLLGEFPFLTDSGQLPLHRGRCGAGSEAGLTRTRLHQ